MLTNYWIYFYTLSKEQQLRQIAIIIVMLLAISVICVFLTFLKAKYLDKTKNSFFQKFLKIL